MAEALDTSLALWQRLQHALRSGASYRALALRHAFYSLVFQIEDKLH
jgi:hypothetical protein